MRQRRRRRDAATAQKVPQPSHHSACQVIALRIDLVPEGGARVT